MNIDDHRARIAELESDLSGGGTAVQFYDNDGELWVHVEIEKGVYPMDFPVGADPDGWDGEVESAIEQLRTGRDS